MYNRMRSSLYCLKGLLNDVLSGLCQYLNGNIIRNHILLNQSTDELVLGVRSGREAHFNFLESDLYQHGEKFQLFIKTHRLNQCLIPVTQIHAAPDRRLFDRVLLHPVIGRGWR